MFDKLLDIKDRAVKKIQNIGLVRTLEIGSGVAALIGLIFVAASSGDNTLASEIVENYDDSIEIEDAVIEDSDKSDPDE